MVCSLLFVALFAPQPVVLVTNDPHTAPAIFFQPATLAKIDGGETTIAVGAKVYQIYKGKTSLLIVDPDTLSVRRLGQLSALAAALAKAPKTGLVSSLGEKAVAALETMLPENLPANFWPGDKVESSLRYQVELSIGYVLSTNDKSVRYSVTPEDDGTSSDNEAFLASAIKYKGRQENTPIPGSDEFLSSTFVVIRSQEANPGAVTRTISDASIDFVDFVMELEAKYSESVYKSLEQFSAAINDAAPNGPATKRLSDLSEARAQSIRSSLISQYKARGFADEAAVERFLSLAEVSFRPSITLRLPVEQRGGTKTSFGYNLGLPKGS